MTLISIGIYLFALSATSLIYLPIYITLIDELRSSQQLSAFHINEEIDHRCHKFS